MFALCNQRSATSTLGLRPAQSSIHSRTQSIYLVYACAYAGYVDVVQHLHNRGCLVTMSRVSMRTHEVGVRVHVRKGAIILLTRKGYFNPSASQKIVSVCL
jgi:hypothetical protein